MWIPASARASDATVIDADKPAADFYELQLQNSKMQLATHLIRHLQEASPKRPCELWETSPTFTITMFREATTNEF